MGLVQHKSQYVKRGGAKTYTKNITLNSHNIRKIRKIVVLYFKRSFRSLFPSIFLRTIIVSHPSVTNGDLLHNEI